MSDEWLVLNCVLAFLLGPPILLQSSSWTHHHVWMLWSCTLWCSSHCWLDVCQDFRRSQWHSMNVNCEINCVKRVLLHIWLPGAEELVCHWEAATSPCRMWGICRDHACSPQCCPRGSHTENSFESAAHQNHRSPFARLSSQQILWDVALDATSVCCCQWQWWLSVWWCNSRCIRLARRKVLGSQSMTDFSWIVTAELPTSRRDARWDRQVDSQTSHTGGSVEQMEVRNWWLESGATL